MTKAEGGSPFRPRQAKKGLSYLIAVHLGLLDVGEVVMKAAHLVSEVRNIKHP